MPGVQFIAGCVLLAASSMFAATPTLSDPRFVTNQFQFQLNGEAEQVYIIQSSPNLTNWSAVLTTVLATNTGTFTLPATNMGQYFRAKVGTPLFNHAVLAQNVDSRDYGIVSDSFDSADPRFSTAGRYDPLKRRDGGDVASYFWLTNMANSQIAGKVWTGPEGAVDLGPSGSVGSLAWVGSGQTGIEPGYWSTNLQESLPAIRLVSMGYGLPFLNATVGGELYNYVFTTGDYRMSALTLSTGKILFNGNCRLFVTDRVSLSSNVVVRFPSAGSWLHLYASGDVQFGAQVEGVVNANQLAIFGLSSCVSIEVSVPNFTGAICTPNALCTLTTTSFVGACTARAVRLNRSVSFHFDENLRRGGVYY